MPAEGNRIYRSPWDGFPDVIVQTTIAKLRSNRAYAAAKRGDEEAAFELVRGLVKPQKIASQFDAVVPVVQFDRGWPNALPLVYGTAIAGHFDLDLSLGDCTAKRRFAHRRRRGYKNSRSKPFSWEISK